MHLLFIRLIFPFNSGKFDLKPGTNMNNLFSGYGTNFRYVGAKGQMVGICMNPMFLIVDNSVSPSLVEQSQQGCGSSCYTLLAVIPSSMKCLIPYACQLASCSVGISY